MRDFERDTAKLAELMACIEAEDKMHCDELLLARAREDESLRIREKGNSAFFEQIGMKNVPRILDELLEKAEKRTDAILAQIRSELEVHSELIEHQKDAASVESFASTVGRGCIEPPIKIRVARDCSAGTTGGTA